MRLLGKRSSRTRTPDEPSSAPVEEAAAEPEPAAPAGPPLRVVVVDDTEDIRALMRLGLEHHGFDVVGEAADGHEAVAVAVREQPDLVLLDLHMPELGGLETIPLLLAECRAKVVVYSAISATYMTSAALDAGATAYIVKGVSPASIAEHLRRVARAGAVRPVAPYPFQGEYHPSDMTG